MSNLTTKELNAKAAEYFDNNEDQDTCHVTSDGQVFAANKINAAQFHAKESKVKIHEIRRADLAKDTAKKKKAEDPNAGSGDEDPGTGGAEETGTKETSEFDSLTIARLKDDLTQKGIEFNPKVKKAEVYEIWKEHFAPKA